MKTEIDFEGLGAVFGKLFAANIPEESINIAFLFG